MIGDILQPTHLLFILVIALLVLGPKRLPEVGRALGRGLRDFRSALNTDELRDQMMSTTNTYTPMPTHQPESADPWAAQPEASHPPTPESAPAAQATPEPPTVTPEPAAAATVTPEPATVVQPSPEPATLVHPPPEPATVEHASPEPAATAPAAEHAD